MDMASIPLQVLNSMSNDPDAELMANETTLAIGNNAPIVSCVKNFGVIGSLKLDSKTVIRRLSVDSCITILSNWKENATIHFDRFLHNKQFSFSYADSEGHSSTIDSDEKLEAILRLHQRKLSNIENGLVPPLELKLETTEEPSTIARLELFETCDSQSYSSEDNNLATCDCDDCGKTVTTGLTYKCLHCNNTYVCDDCRKTDEKHSFHLLLPCLVLILGAEHTYIAQADEPIQLVGDSHDNRK